MAFRDDLDLYAPELYRFACALVSGHKGPCPQAANLVRAVLSSPLESGLRLRGDKLRVRLFSVLVDGHRRQLKLGRAGIAAHVEIDNLHISSQNIGVTASVIASPQNNFAASLLDLGLDEREALLLVALAGFTYPQSARILKISRSALIDRLARARGALSLTAPADNFARSIKPRPSYLRVVK